MYLILFSLAEHRWIYNADQVPNIPLGENVRARIKQFSLMNKFKKKVLRVSCSKMLICPPIPITPILTLEAFLFDSSSNKLQVVNRTFVDIGSR